MQLNDSNCPGKRGEMMRRSGDTGGGSVIDEALAADTEGSWERMVESMNCSLWYTDSECEVDDNRQHRTPLFAEVNTQQPVFWSRWNALSGVHVWKLQDVRCALEQSKPAGLFDVFIYKHMFSCIYNCTNKVI